MPDLARIEGASGDPGLCIGGLTSRGFIQEVRECPDHVRRAAGGLSPACRERANRLECF
jgi:hypothetical protein